MSNHQKRLAVPKSWPVARKEETYTTKAGAGPHGEEGVPLLIVLRDVLGYVDSKKEARYALGQDSVLVNGEPVSDERVPIGMFDILAFLEREEYYRVFPDEGGRLSLTPIDAEAADSKLGKIDRKTQVPGGDTQLTLHDGRTLLVDDDATYATNDSIVVANEGDEIVAHFTYEEGALVTAVRGAHAGRVGTVDEIQVTPGSSDNNVLIDAAEDEDFETVEEFVVVIDENFTEDSESGPEPSVDETPGVDEDPADDEVSDVGEESATETEDESRTDEAEESEAEETEESASVEESEAEETEESASVEESEAEETEESASVEESEVEETEESASVEESEAEETEAEAATDGDDAEDGGDEQ